MGTRSIIAIPDGSDAWKGRYAHWDGYPTGVGAQLFAIVKRDGLDAAIQKLTADRYGWSSIDADQDGDAKLPPGHDDGRFAYEHGYGLAYTTEQGQSSEDMWLTVGSTWGTEWCYILAPTGMMIGRVLGDESITPVNMVPWDSDPDFAAIEADAYAKEG